MKKINTQLLLLFSMVLLLVTSCTDDPIVDKAEANLFDEKGAIVTISNVMPGIFDLTDRDNAAVSFDLGEAGVESLESISISKSYNGGDAVAVSTVTPGPITVSLADAVSGFGVAVADVAVADVFLYTFDAVSASGFTSTRSLSITASCPSSLGGTYTYVSTELVAANSTTACPEGEVTGEVTFTDKGSGVYEISDLGFGQYGSSCWSDSPATSGDATITDVCNVISSGGLDQYGLVYTWTITSVDGPKMSISWVNDYADSGKTVLSRTDGTDWPSLSTN